MNKILKLRALLVLTFFLMSSGVVWYYKISAERLEKKAKEIERIESSSSYEKAYCEQYALVASKAGWFPCFKCKGRDKIFLKKDEVWRYGKTCNGQDGRYPNGLPFENLKYEIQFTGTEKECLIEEKNKIYNYPNLSECKKRNFVLHRPPGNKIDR